MTKLYQLVEVILRHIVYRYGRLVAHGDKYTYRFDHSLCPVHSDSTTLEKESIASLRLKDESERGRWSTVAFSISFHLLLPVFLSNLLEICPSCDNNYLWGVLQHGASCRFDIPLVSTLSFTLWPGVIGALDHEVRQATQTVCISSVDGQVPGECRPGCRDSVNSKIHATDLVDTTAVATIMKQPLWPTDSTWSFMLIDV